MANEKQYRDFVETFIHFRREGKSVPEQQIISDLFALKKYEGQLRNIYTRQCNGYCNSFTGKNDDEQQSRDQKRGKKIEADVEDIIARYGFGVRFNTDPRGGAIRFVFPSGVSNNWDQETWGIYW